MNSIILIIDGIGLPFHLIDHAIQKAKDGEYGITALFLKGEHEPSAGYGYPSDLKAAENLTTEDEAIREDEKIISDNMQLVKSMIESKDIAYREMILTKPSAEKIATIASTADFVMIDADFDTKALLSSKILLQELAEVIIVPLIEVTT